MIPSSANLSSSNRGIDSQACKRLRVTSNDTRSEALQSTASLRLIVDGVGTVSIVLDPRNAPRTVATLAMLARSNSPSGHVHRAEAVPSGDGPPYGLVQATLSDPMDSLKVLRREGTKQIIRGSACLIGGTSDVFLSLMPHAGWERSMTVFGHVVEEELTANVEPILKKPIHEFRHPTHGTLMAMLDTKLQVLLEEDGVPREVLEAVAFDRDPANSKWQVHFSSGRPYYFDTDTKLTQWERPM